MRAINPRLIEWHGRRVWLVGATTGIGRACAQALREAGAQVIVSARRPADLVAWAERDAGVRWLPMDATDLSAVHAAAESAWRDGPVDLVLYCAATWQPLRADAWDLPTLLRHQAVNWTGALHVIDAVLPRLRERGAGHLSLVSSVAGWRGLPRGLAYGPTKAALTHLAEVLQLDLRPHGIGVSVIHPGFVDTPLTAGNEFPMPQLQSPERAAQAMLRGWAKGHFDIRFPWGFVLALRLLRLLPDALYFALVRRVTGL